MSRNMRIHKAHKDGFTLVELLTVMTVVTVVTAIVLPFLNGARKAARAVVCQSNVRDTGLAFLVYCESYDGCLPPAYTYVGGAGLYRQPEEPVDGILHWSGVLLAEGRVTEDVLHCPEIPHGGLAPRNTTDDNLDRHQQSERDGVVDVQAERCAFTVNEVLCPRNRFKTGWEGAQRPSRIVAASRIRRQGSTILLTEWPRDWWIVSGPDTNLSNSFLPVHGFRGLGAMVGPDRYDLNMMASDSTRPCTSSGVFRRVDAYDLSDAPSGSRRYPPRLDWVGRNHAGIGTAKDMKKSVFFYLDGHVALKTVYDTVEETGFEWGDRIYSLTGCNSID